MKLETLVALNEEILGLTRSGVPLGQGLLQIKSGVSMELRRITTEIGRRLESGESMTQIINDPRFPGWYAAVVRAGLESGQLTLALEPVTAMLRRQIEIRQFVFAALVYPVFVLCLTVSLFSILFHSLYTQWIDFHRAQALSGPSPSQSVILQLADAVAPILPWCGLLLVVLLLSLWLVTGRTIRSPEAVFRWVPSVSKMLHDGQSMVFLDVLAAMMDANTPLASALITSAAATGNRVFQEDAERLSLQLNQGMTSQCRRETRFGIPNVVVWSLQNDRNESSWKSSIRGLSDAYFWRIRYQDRLFRDSFPILATLLLGGTFVGVYCFMMLVPWIKLITSLAEAIY